MVGKELVRVEHLTKHFPAGKSILGRNRSFLHAVDDVPFTIHEGETLGLVGESGCGKSTTGRCLLQMYPDIYGRIWFDGQEITGLKGDALRNLRRNMQIVFQDPFASLDPSMTAGEIVEEPIRTFLRMDREERKNRVEELFLMVGLDPAMTERFPHEFSGGQRQRIGIARALAVKPRFLVCDEPVSALDVSIQAQVVNLLKKLQKEQNLTYLFIAHDLAVVKNISTRIAVMYLGKIVETAFSDALCDAPAHPYTQALLSAVPVPDPEIARTGTRILLQGDVPSPVDPPPGCRFCTRCARCREKCRNETPVLMPVGGDETHLAACHYPLL